MKHAWLRQILFFKQTCTCLTCSQSVYFACYQFVILININVYYCTTITTDFSITSSPYSITNIRLTINMFTIVNITKTIQNAK